ncbi:MAG: tetratricopeptide repeat protein [Coleofasciculaceae cyanobacterium SM2_1_6]|nr:tetratricopeptide repeat protein [Coleofasciculaceae cyanobacterium SM2_1_6]
MRQPWLLLTLIPLVSLPVPAWGQVSAGIAEPLGNHQFSGQVNQLIAQISIDEDFIQRPLNRPVRDLRNDADTLLRLGEAEERRGSLEKAIPFWLEALELYQMVRDEQAIGRTLELLGITYGNLGQLREAEATLRQRLAIARDNQDITGQIYGLNNLGAILVKRRSYAAANALFNEALTVSRRVNSAAGEGLSLSNLGLLAFSMGDFDEAIKRYEAALRFRRSPQDPIGEVNTLLGLAESYRLLNQYRQAMVNYFDALRTSRIIRDVANEFRILAGMHTTYLAMNQPELALKALDERMLLAQQTQNEPQELNTLITYGRFYNTVGDRLEAKNYLERAIALAASLGDTGQEAALKNELAQVIFILDRTN